MRETAHYLTFKLTFNLTLNNVRNSTLFNIEEAATISPLTNPSCSAGPRNFLTRPTQIMKECNNSQIPKNSLLCFVGSLIRFLMYLKRLTKITYSQQQTNPKSLQPDYLISQTLYIVTKQSLYVVINLVATFLQLQNCHFMQFQIVIFMKQSNCHYQIVTFL